MTHGWRFRFLIVMASLVLAPAHLTAVAGAPGPVWTPQEREELLGYGRATWHSFEEMTAGDGLPADQLLEDKPGHWQASRQTSPTDIAAYLWSTLAARSLALIDDAETDRRLGSTLATLTGLERQHGFFFNLYDVTTRVRIGGKDKHPARPFLSSVDNGWLAAALIMVRNARPALRDQADELLKPMNFGFFYAPFDAADPVKHPGQLHGGYFTDDQSFTAAYGMLNTEPRIVSYIAITRGQIPPEHYYRLFRTFPVERGPQTQVPEGETRTYQGLPVFEGHYTVRGRQIVPSWGGSMFEALMVPLFVPEETWAPTSWGINHPLYVQAQIEQGLDVLKYRFWGFSPACTPEGGYQTFGVKALGTEASGYRAFEVHPHPGSKSPRAADLSRAGVVTPHASFLALRYAPRESLANLRGLSKSFPILGIQGFHDSVDVANGTVSHCVLSLDQGMIMAAIANALDDDTLRHAFTAGAIETTIRPLIAPEQFTARER